MLQLQKNLKVSDHFITESWYREVFDVRESDILLNICLMLGFPRDLIPFLHLDEHLRKPSEHLFHTTCGTENLPWMHSSLAGFQPGTNPLKERWICKLNTDIHNEK